MRLIPVIKSIKTKLFLTLLMASSGVAIAMFLVMQWSFDRGFLNYVNTQEKEHMMSLGDALIDVYQSEGSWDQLTNNHRQWHQLISNSAPDLNSGPPPDHKRRPPPPRRNEKNRVNDDFRSGQPQNFQRPPHHNPPPFGESSRPPKKEGRHPPPPRKPRPKVILLDADKNTLFGPPEGIEQFSLSPLTSQGETIGYVGIKPAKEISDAHDLVFAQEQSQTFLMIAVAMVVISILLSVPVASSLVRPIRRLAQGTQRLISGKFDTHIPITTYDELGTLSTDFNTLATTLKENEHARQQWVADISHELRTPLAILKGEIEAIEDGIRQPTPNNISSLGQEVNHLSHLVNDLYELSMSDIGALNYQKSNTDILPIVQHCVDSFIDQFSQKNITLSQSPTAEPEVELLIDPQRVKQLINNLLKNSYRYTDEGGTSHVSVEVTTNDVLIHIDDSAPGVPSSEIPKLFERLYRVEGSRNRASGGAGLGLAICNNIVNAHDGKIYAQPSSHGGLRVSVQLPITRGKQR